MGQSRGREIEVAQIRPFREYPFRVRDDDAMHELVESIMRDGVLVPVTVRRTDGAYEMISGHRRLFAAKQIGLKRIPAIVKDYDDEEAVLAMADAALQREGALPSEKAFTYRMCYDAMREFAKKEAGRRPSATRKKEQLDIVLAKAVGESRAKLHRYLRLVHLIPVMLDLVDTYALALETAVEVSFLESQVQEMLYDYMKENDICKSYQLYAVRDYLKENETITRMELIRILNENAPPEFKNQFQKITIRKSKLREYFPGFYTKSQMENVIFGLLEGWKKENNSESN